MTGDQIAAILHAGGSLEEADQQVTHGSDQPRSQPDEAPNQRGVSAGSQPTVCQSNISRGPLTMPNTTAPNRPIQDFFGLSRGHILTFPHQPPK